MEKESLTEARTIILEKILTSNIKQIDKVELALNLDHFLSNYEENIKILKKTQNKWKQELK